MSRRSFLVSGVSLAGLGLSGMNALADPAAKALPSNVDVAVVGAGAAGLSAAHALRAAGLNVVVLEGRSRVGGRVFTDTSLGAPFDAGAQYIHWAETNPWTPIADQLGMAHPQETMSGAFVLARGGVALDDAARRRRRRGFSELDLLLESKDSTDTSFADLARARPAEVRAAAAALTRLALGEEPERVSVDDYSNLWSGEDDIVPEGYGTLVSRFGADLPVSLETLVTGIDYAGPGVSLATNRGTLRARACIVTVPVGVLLRESIRFTPTLPDTIRDAVSGLHMGAYTKIALKLDPDRLDQIHPADALDLGPLDLERDGAMVSFEIRPFGRPLVLAVVGGDQARELCEAGEAHAVAYAGDRLVQLLGGNARAAITGGRLAAWWSDPLAGGSYSVAWPGRGSAREALRQPVADRIWFAGEASAGSGAMTVGGASLEGARAAREIATKLAG